MAPDDVHDVSPAVLMDGAILYKGHRQFGAVLWMPIPVARDVTSPFRPGTQDQTLHPFPGTPGARVEWLRRTRRGTRESTTPLCRAVSGPFTTRGLDDPGSDRQRRRQADRGWHPAASSHLPEAGLAPHSRSVSRPAAHVPPLRHTHPTKLIEQGEHAEVIQLRLGHSSIQVTLDTYGHPLGGIDEATAQRLDAKFLRTVADSRPKGPSRTHPVSNPRRVETPAVARVSTVDSRVELRGFEPLTP